MAIELVQYIAHLFILFLIHFACAGEVHSDILYSTTALPRAAVDVILPEAPDYLSACNTTARIS